MNVRKKLVIQTRHFARYFTLVFQADTRGATQVLDRGGQEVGRGSCLSQVIDRGAQVVARGAARIAPHVLDRGAEAVAQTVSCGDAMLPQQEKSTRQKSRRTE